MEKNLEIHIDKQKVSSKYSGILAIPFMIAFAVQFVNEKEDWVRNGQFEVQLPGDLFLYFSLIMLNFSWAFACIYYRLSFKVIECYPCHQIISRRSFTVLIPRCTDISHVSYANSYPFKPKSVLSMTLEAKEYEFDNVIEDVKKVNFENLIQSV